MTIERYDITILEDGEMGMQKHPFGDYVAYADYEDLLENFNSLEEQYYRFVGKLRDLYMEV